MLTIDQLKKRGRALVSRCFLCGKDEETIDHLLLHCSVLWDLLLAIFRVNWVFPKSVRETLISWQGSFVERDGRRLGWQRP